MVNVDYDHATVRVMIHFICAMLSANYCGKKNVYSEQFWKEFTFLTSYISQNFPLAKFKSNGHSKAWWSV